MENATLSCSIGLQIFLIIGVMGRRWYLPKTIAERWW